MNKKISLSILAAGVCLLTFCTASKKTTTVATVKVIPVSFQTDVYPIMQLHCTPCHFPEAGQKKMLNTYDAASEWFTDIIERVQLPATDEKFMPFKGKKPALNEAEIKTLIAWKDQKMPK